MSSVDRVQFFSVIKGGKRSFTMRPGSVTGKTIALMSTIPDFEIWDTASGTLVSPDAATTDCQQMTFNRYPFVGGREYEVRARAVDGIGENFVPFCRLDELEPASNSDRYCLRRGGVEGRDVLVWRDTAGGELGCIDAVCYHFGGPLEVGDIEDVAGNACIVCPWHRYPIALRSGECLLRHSADGSGPVSKGVKQRRHSVRVEGDTVLVKLELGGEQGEVESDHYANMGLYRTAEQNSTVEGLHSSRSDGSVSGSAAGGRRRGRAGAGEQWCAARLTQRRDESVRALLLSFVVDDDSERELFAKMPPGYHVTMRFTTSDGELRRDYTPLLCVNGELDFVIKLYDGGPGSTSLAALSVGDRIELTPPRGRLALRKLLETGAVRHLIMICNGSGVTPMYTCLKEAMARSRGAGGGIGVHMLYCSRAADECMLHSELNQMQVAFRKHFFLLHYFSRESGRISGEQVRAFVRQAPQPPRSLVLLCGSDAFTEMVMSALADIPKESIHMF